MAECQSAGGQPLVAVGSHREVGLKQTPAGPENTSEPRMNMVVLWKPSREAEVTRKNTCYPRVQKPTPALRHHDGSYSPKRRDSALNTHHVPAWRAPGLQRKTPAFPELMVWGGPQASTRHVVSSVLQQKLVHSALGTQEKE